MAIDWLKSSLDKDCQSNIIGLHYLQSRSLHTCLYIVCSAPSVLYTVGWTTGRAFCLHFYGHYSDGSGLTVAKKSPFWILLELRMTEVVVTTGAIRCTKLQIVSWTPSFFYRPDAIPVAQPTVSKHWRHIIDDNDGGDSTKRLKLGSQNLLKHDDTWGPQCNCETGLFPTGQRQWSWI